MISKLYEMANVSKSDTGLPYNLWIDSSGKSRNNKHHKPRIKVEVDKKLIPVSISENPKILVRRGTNFPKFNEVKEFIVKHLDTFMKHWNREITDRQALNKLVEDK